MSFTKSVTETKKFKQAEKELTRILTGFRPNKKEVEKKISLLPFLGAAAGLVCGLVYVFCFWPVDISKTIPFSSWYRLAALPPVIGFPITTVLMGIIAGKVIELLIRRLRN